MRILRTPAHWHDDLPGFKYPLRHAAVADGAGGPEQSAGVVADSVAGTTS